MTDQVITLRLVAQSGQAVGELKLTRKEILDTAAAAKTASASTTAAQAAVQKSFGATASAAQSSGQRVAQSYNSASRAATSFSASVRASTAAVVASQSRMDASLETIGRRFSALQRYSGWAAAIGVSGATIVGVSNLADGYTNLTSKLRVVTTTEQELTRVRERLLGLSQETRSQFESTVGLYARLTRATENLNFTEQTRLRLVETINKSFIVSGATTREAAAATIQLSQGLAAGVLRGEEFNSVSEQAPAILELMTKSLGLTRGELRKFAEDGGLTAEVVTKALLQGGDQIDAQFQRVGLTIAGAGQQLANSFQEWIGSTNDGIGAADALAGSLSFLANNLETILNLIGLAAVAWGAKYVAGMAAAFVAQVQMVQGATAVVAAELNAARAAEAAALSHLNLARAMGSAAVASGQMAAAQTAATAATARLAAAQGAATFAAASSTGAFAIFGRGLLAMVGGPVGAGIIALGALAFSISSAVEAEADRRAQFEAGFQNLRDSTQAVTELAEGYRSLAAVPPPPLTEGLRAAAEASSVLKTQQEALAVAQERLNGLYNENARMVARFGVGSSAYEAAKVEVEKLEAALNSATNAQEGLSSELAERFAPAVRIAAQAVAELFSVDDPLEFFGKLREGLSGFMDEFDRIKSADKEAQDLYGKILDGNKKVEESLKTAGKSASQMAGELVKLALAKADEANWSEAQIAALKTLGAEYVKNTNAETAAKNATKFAEEARRKKKQADEEAARALEALTNATLENSLAQLELVGLLDPSVAAQNEYAAAMIRAEQVMREQIMAGLDQATAARQFNLEQEYQLKLMDRKQRQLEEELDLVGSHAKAVEQEVKLLGLSNRERAIETAVLEAAAKAREQYNQGLRETPALSAAEQSAIRSATGGLFDMQEQAEMSRDAVTELGRVGTTAMEGFSNAIGDFVVGNIKSFSDLWKTFKDLAKRAIADVIAMLIKAQLMKMITGQGGGAGGIIGAMFSGAAEGAAAGDGQGGAGIMRYVPVLAALAGGAWGLTQRGSSTGSAGSLGAAAAYGYAGYAAGTVALGAALGAGGAVAGAGVGAAAGGALSGAAGAAAAIPVAGWIIAAIAAIDMITGGKVFGSRYRAESSTSSINIGADGGMASASVRDVRNRSLFRGRQWRTRSVDAGDEAREAAEDLFDAIEGTMIDAARRLQVEVPPVIDAAIRTVNEYDKKGKVKSTKIFVDLLGRTWEEATAELAATRITAESIIAVLDSTFATVPQAIADAVNPEEIIDRVGRRFNQAGAAPVTHAGEASQIAERWRGDAEDLLAGAQALLAIAADMRNGFDLLGTGTLTPIVNLLEEMAIGGESLLDTYQRLAGATRLLDDALAITGVSLDLSREAYIRHAAAIVDAAGGMERATALWQSFDANFFTDEERGARTLGRARANADTQLGDIGLETEDFTGEGGMAALRAMFEEQMPTLSAEATVEWLEALDALAQVTAAQAAYNQVLGQASARTVGQIQEARALLIGVANERNYAQMTTAQRAIADVNARFSDLRATLNATNPTLAEAAELERGRMQAIVDANAALQAQADELVGNLLFEESLVGLDALGQAQAQINRQFDGYVATLIDLGFELDSVEVSTVNNIRAARLLRAETDSLAESAEQAASAVATISWAEIDQMIEEWFQGLVDKARRFFGDGAREWISEMTGVTLREAPAPLATRSGTLNRFMEERAAFIEDMNEQLLTLQQQLDNTSWQDTGTVALLEGRIENINRVLRLIGDGVTEAVDYINAVFDQQIGDMLSGLAQEFGTANPLDVINERFDRMIDQANAWGATVEQLAQIEMYRQMALAEAQEQSFNDQMDWLRRLADLRDSLLLDQQLTTLTPQERLEEAERQYQLTFAGALAGDVNSRNKFDSVARQYAEELRAYWGSSEQYTMGFNNILGGIAQLMAAGPVAAQSAQETYLAEIATVSTASNEMMVTLNSGIGQVVAEVAGLREDTREGSLVVAEALAALNERMDLLVGGQAVTNTELRGIREGAIVRTN